jgi:hypothetical protein
MKFGWSSAIKICLNSVNCGKSFKNTPDGLFVNCIGRGLLMGICTPLRIGYGIFMLDAFERALWLMMERVIGFTGEMSCRKLSGKGKKPCRPDEFF